MRFRQVRYVVFFLLLTGACIEPYDLPVNDEDVKFLVVDGFINATDGTAHVTLTRTIPIASEEPMPPETGAFVAVEDEHGTTSVLAETEPGIYSGPVGDPRFDKQYRLTIRTDDTHEYASDFTQLMETPPIDSISYYAVADGLELAVNTHDITGRSRYFRWKFEETFQYYANFNSVYMFDGDELVFRMPDESLLTCWRTNASTGILVGSTEHLSESVVRYFRLGVVPKGSVKLSVKYSLLVRQQSLSQDAYNYWLNLQKSTEQLGGFFDPLPSEVKGNIHNVDNPDEKVIGFFSGGTTEEKRIFIRYSDLPSELTSYNSWNPSCLLDTLSLQDMEIIPKTTLIVNAVYGEFGEGLIGYTTSTRECIDCTYHGGVPVKPLFWE